METISAKRVAKVKPTLNKRTVEALRPEDKSWIARDDRLTRFGMQEFSKADRLGEAPPATLSPGHIALVEATYCAVYVPAPLHLRKRWIS